MCMLGLHTKLEQEAVQPDETQHPVWHQEPDLQPQLCHGYPRHYVTSDLAILRPRTDRH